MSNEHLRRDDCAPALSISHMDMVFVCPSFSALGPLLTSMVCQTMVSFWDLFFLFSKSWPICFPVHTAYVSQVGSTGWTVTTASPGLKPSLVPHLLMRPPAQWEPLFLKDGSCWMILSLSLFRLPVLGEGLPWKAASRA